jgi:hypothetical protein
MKKIAIFTYVIFLLCSCQPISQESKSDIEIVGRWDYLKTVDPDGSEEFGVVGMEHYYTDGTVLYLNMWLDPFSMDSLPKSPEEIMAAHQITDGGIGTYEIDPEKNWLKIHLKVATDTAWFNKSFEFTYKIIGDTIIFRDKYYFVKVKE